MNVKEFYKKHKTKIIFGGVITVVAVGCALYTRSKINGMNKLLKVAINDASNKIPVNVSDIIVDQAISRAVDREVTKAARTAAILVADDIRYDLKKEVRNAINTSYVDIKGCVSDEIAKQVSNININKLRDEVAVKAKELIVEKLDSNMDSILEDYNKNLSNVSKIYSSIAESMTPKKAAETVIKVG